MLDWGSYVCRPCGWWWGSYHVEEHIRLQLFTCKFMFKLLKTKNRPPLKEGGQWPSDGWWARWQILRHVKLCCVTGHAIRAAMGTVWETWRVWPLWTCVWREDHLLSPVTMCITPYDHTSSKAFLPSKHHSTHNPLLPSCTQPPEKCPLHWCTLHGYWPLICFRSMALLLADPHSSNNATPHALHVFKYWFAQRFLQLQKRSLRQGMEQNMRGQLNRHTKTPPQEKRQKVWWLFNFCKDWKTASSGCSSWNPH